MIYYIIDTTLNPSKEVRFNSFQETVKYLEGISERAYRQTRKQRMVLLEELGHGYDDNNSVTFVRNMMSGFEMGIVCNDVGLSRRMKCDITSIPLYQSEEFGN